jgi:hypothetical protein
MEGDGQREELAEKIAGIIDTMPDKEEESIIEKIEGIGEEVVEDLIMLEKKIISPKTAAFLLLAACVLGFLSALIILDEETPTFEPPSVRFNNIAGYALHENGTGAQGTVVSLVRTKYSTQTSYEGYYVLEAVPSTDYTLKFSKDGYKDVVIYIEVVGERPMAYDITMRPGTGVIVIDDRPEEVHIYETNFLFGMMITIASLSSLVGAMLAYTQRSFVLTVSAAGIGVLSYGFLIGSGLALIALIFILLSRTEFIKARHERQSLAA